MSTPISPLTVTPPPTPDEDDELMLRLQGGDRTAFDQLVEKHQSALVGFFIRHLGDAQLGEDLTQETLLRVYQQSWDYLPRGCFRGWMFRIARNLLIDNTRRRSHDALVRAVRSRPTVRDDENDDGLSQVQEEQPAPQDLAAQHEVARVVDGLFPKLPEEQKLTFILYHYAQLSLPEIADAMETTLPTAKSRLRLSREKLRDMLKDLGYDDPGLPEDDA